MSGAIAHATAANFDDLVLGNSQRGLVLVHYWSPRAGPCLQLMPRLTALAEAYAGRFLLVLMNTDDLAARARAEGVTSVPTVKFYLRGEVVHSIHGAEPDATFRQALSRFLADEESLDRARAEAMAARRQGDAGRAVEILARAAVDRPEDLDIAADLARSLLLQGDSARALALLGTLPADARRDGRIAPLLVHAELIEAAAGDEADAPAGPDAALAHAAHALVVDDDPEAAMTALLALAQTHPDYRDDIGRRALIALFDMLGNGHALTRRFRARLAAGWH